MELSLPPQIASRRDIIKLQRQIEQLLEERLQRRISQQQVGQLRNVSNPTRLIVQFFEHNKLEVTDQTLEQTLKHLEVLRQKAPMIRIAFATEPDFETSEKIVYWFRRQIDSKVLVQIGVQPMIAGGCVVQSPMRRYDFSLRKKILESNDKLVEVLRRVG